MQTEPKVKADKDSGCYYQGWGSIQKELIYPFSILELKELELNEVETINLGILIMQ